MFQKYFRETKKRILKVLSIFRLFKNTNCMYVNIINTTIND